jgi:hypothetical protein
VQRLAHRPADDLAGMQILYGGEVKPAFAGGDVGQVGEPNLASSIRDKVPAEPVGCDRVGVPTIRRSGPSLQGRQAASPRLTHQSLDPGTTNPAEMGFDEPQLLVRRPARISVNTSAVPASPPAALASMSARTALPTWIGARLTARWW